MDQRQKMQRNIFHNQLKNVAESIDIDKLSDEARNDVKKALQYLQSGEPIKPKQYTAIAMKLSPFMDIKKREDIDLYKKVYNQ